MLAGVYGGETHRCRALREHAHRAGRAHVGFHRAFEGFGVEARGADARRERDDDGLREHLLGGGEILLQQHRRHREDIPDVVEAVARVVGGKVIGGAEVHADEVADGVVVFRAIEPAQRDAAGVGLLAVALEDLEINPRLNHLALRERGLLLLVRRRHLTAADIDQGVLPKLSVREQLRVRLVFVKLHTGLLRPIAMAVEAILLEQGQHVLLVGQLRRVLCRRRTEERPRGEGGDGEPGQTDGDKQFHARRQDDREADARQPTEIACGCKRDPTATHPPRNLRRDSDRAESPPCDSPG